MGQNSPEISIGKIKIGGKNPPAVQSMTDESAENPQKCAAQILQLATAGAEIVRIALPDFSAAKNFGRIFELVRAKSDVPLVGDFHFNGNLILKKFPEVAKNLDKFRINPGNADEKNFCEIVEIAIREKKPVRIGVNSGSIDKKIFEKIAENFDQNLENEKKNFENLAEKFLKNENLDFAKFRREKILERAAIESALQSAAAAQKIGLPKNRIVLSAKMSNVRSTIAVHEILAAENFALHIGLTEAGSGLPGIVASSVALGILLEKKIGDTFRVSITPDKIFDRTAEIRVAREILQNLAIKNFGPKIISCPGCGRTNKKKFQNLVEKISPKIRENFAGKNLQIAIMGCVVNGPGESAHCDAGISLPGRGEKNFAAVFLRGKFFKNLRGENLDEQFLQILRENF